MTNLNYLDAFFSFGEGKLLSVEKNSRSGYYYATTLSSPSFEFVSWGLSMDKYNQFQGFIASSKELLPIAMADTVSQSLRRLNAKLGALYSFDYSLKTVQPKFKLQSEFEGEIFNVTFDDIVREMKKVEESSDNPYWFDDAVRECSKDTHPNLHALLNCELSPQINKDLTKAMFLE